MAYMNAARRLAGGRFLHVTTQRTVLAQSGHRLVVYRKDEKIAEFPMAQIRGVVLYGDVRPSSGAIRLCLTEGISLTMLSLQGRFRGRLASASDHGAELRVRQYERSRDTTFCLMLARNIVRGKLLSALAHIDRRSKQLEASHPRATDTIRRCLDRATTAADLDTLRGWEGSGSAAYFEVLRQSLNVETGFQTRQRDHADPVNALLNLSYTMIRQECEALLHAAGLDPAIGFYHALDPGRPSLACDWQEEFRHAHADPLVLAVLNRRQLDPGKDFRPAPSGGGWRLTPDGLVRFLREYEKRAGAWRPQMLSQLEQLSDAISNGQPYRSHWERGNGPLSGGV